MKRKQLYEITCNGRVVSTTIRPISAAAEVAYLNRTDKRNDYALRKAGKESK